MSIVSGSNIVTIVDNNANQDLLLKVDFDFLFGFFRSYIGPNGRFIDFQTGFKKKDKSVNSPRYVIRFQNHQGTNPVPYLLIRINIILAKFFKEVPMHGFPLISYIYRQKTPVNL